MSSKIDIRTPSHKLPLLLKLMMAGLLIGLVLMALEIYMKSNFAQPSWIWSLLGHIGTATFVATIVGIGIDRLFYHDHLNSMATSMTNELIKFDNRITEFIPKVLSSMVAGKTLKYLKDSREIYPLINSKMEEYRYFTNTIINQQIGDPSTYREEYYKRKVDLVNNGKLICRELISPNTVHLVKDSQFDKINEHYRNNFRFKIVELSPTLITFVNFCIFQNNFEENQNAFLMIGWFSDDKSLYHKHSCIATDHPDLIKMFSKYFDILERTAREYVNS